MLELKKIKKFYQTGDFKQEALKGVSVKFRKHEFVSILGPSGSGKTTLLNIIGGLDKYTSGDLIINGKSTKQFKDTEWDSYRNNSIGFIFQSYNLINHISVLENIEMGMTLSGVNNKKRKKKALEVLKKVGLKEHAHKKPNQLSGGQMQRVAIARALANDPDIILADEPTGALDSKTSIQIMNLIKEISKDKLVIMVTHNPSLAEEYASRIIEFKDGDLISDSNPIDEEDITDNKYKFKKTAMNYLTALNLSFNNIKTKKGRTLLTAFASSIGIIGIALILSLSNGFDIKIDEFQQNTLSSLPIMISSQSMELDEESMLQIRDEQMGTKYEQYPDVSVIYPKQQITQALHTNKITTELIEHIEKIDGYNVSGVSYTRTTALNMLISNNDVVTPFSSRYFTAIPKTLDESLDDILKDNYDLLYGSFPSKKEDIVLIVDSSNRVDAELLKLLGFNSEEESIEFKDILGKEIKVVLNDDYYKQMGDYFTVNMDFNTLYESKNNVTLKIAGIIRGKEDKVLSTMTTSLAYTEGLVNYVIDKNSNSKIVKKQQDSSFNVLTGEQFDLNTEEGTKTKESILTYLGAEDIPVLINIYPRSFEAKDELLEHLDNYNVGKTQENKIIYTDMANLISSLSSSIMDAITVVLIAFSAISLVVSGIMIGIITYISVLERTKEIGVLRALGARKKDISRVFNAETFIIGITSGLLGILIARLLIIPANMIIENLTDLPNVAKLNPLHAIVLIIISVILTVIGGAIPAKIASKKDPVEALRTE